MNRGDVVPFDFPFSDRTGSKLRPAVVVQADSLNQSIDDKRSGLAHTSVVDCKNLLTSNQKFVYAKIGDLSPATLPQLDECLKAALGLA